MEYYLLDVTRQYGLIVIDMAFHAFNIGSTRTTKNTTMTLYQTIFKELNPHRIADLSLLGGGRMLLILEIDSTSQFLSDVLAHGYQPVPYPSEASYNMMDKVPDIRDMVLDRLPSMLKTLYQIESSNE